MHIKKIVIAVVVLFPHLLVAQTISGKVENSDGEKIFVANVVIKDSLNSESIREFVIARNGQYAITLKSQYSKIVIEVSANRYFKEYFEIDNPSKSSSYIHNFVLKKDSVRKLEQVIIKTKTKPFQISDDTVKYKVSAYRDGSERKIQDILKKLPYVDVNGKTGEIKYKGKPVETVKLDGDDLFGSDYTVGTKNINVGMVEEVQAIENYSDNPLLKGIESGDKVALNLKLKKTKMEFSGDLDFGSGISANEKPVYDAAANVLGISNGYKSFGTLSYNNIGDNNSPYDYFSYVPNAEQIRENTFLARKIIPEVVFSSELDDKRANINSAWFASYNAISKIRQRASIKTNLYYIKDGITAHQVMENNNYINGQPILTSDDYSFKKMPRQYRGDVEVKYNASKKSLLEYNLKVSRETIHTATNVLQNNTSSYLAELKTKDLNVKQSLLFTQKVSDKKVLQVLFNQSLNDLPQNYFFNPSLYNPVLYSADNQYSYFRKNITGLRSTFLGTQGKSKYSFSLGGNIESDPFRSRLTGIDKGTVNTIDSFTNYFSFKKHSLYHLGAYSFFLGRFKFSPSYSLHYLQQQLDGYYTNKKTENIIFEPALSVSYKPGNLSAIIATISQRQKPFSEEYFFDKPIYISNRVIRTNEVDLQLQKTSSLGLFYLMNNLYRQFQLQLGMNVTENQGNYFSNIFIRPTTTRMHYFYLPEPNRSTNVNFLIEKYIPLLQSTVRLRSAYSLSNYKNIVNNSELRNNNYQTFSSELFMKTAFDFKVNFENVIRYKRNRSKSENSEPFINEAINNTSQVIIKPNKNVFILLTSDYFLPSLQQTANKYLFLDGTVQFTPKNKLVTLSFTAKNILNNTDFTQVETSDYSTTIFRSNLLPRYFMLRISYGF